MLKYIVTQSTNLLLFIIIKIFEILIFLTMQTFVFRPHLIKHIFKNTLKTNDACSQKLFFYYAFPQRLIQIPTTGLKSFYQVPLAVLW